MTDPAEALADARVRTSAAARAAGVQLRREEDPTGLLAVADMFAEIWGTPAACPPLPADVLRSLTHAGGAVHVAYRDAVPVGAAVAFFDAPAARGVYSLIAGARSSDRGIGFALKQAQRAWALELGVVTMRWTFDPLVGRNARFNLVKLGAVAREYSVDFYGPLADGVNDNDETDRLTAQWTLTDVRPAEPPLVAGPPDLAFAERIATAPDGRPLAVRSDGGIWCRVPRDIVALRRRDAGTAMRWRENVREVFEPAFAAGLAATGITRDGWYHLTREDSR